VTCPCKLSAQLTAVHACSSTTAGIGSTPKQFARHRGQRRGQHLLDQGPMRPCAATYGMCSSSSGSSGSLRSGFSVGCVRCAQALNTFLQDPSTSSLRHLICRHGSMPRPGLSSNSCSAGQAACTLLSIHGRTCSWSMCL
jgi:hypothetical protein